VSGLARRLDGALRRLGLGRPEARAWALYDWANSAFVTTVTAAVFPIYFSEVAAAGMPAARATARYGTATTVALAVVAVLAPFLGALADVTARKKRFLGMFLGIGVAATAALFLVREGDWQLGALLFVAGNVGAWGSFVFYDSLLPHVVAEGELDRTATSAFALGYLGGGLLLALNLAWIVKPAWFGMGDADPTLPSRLAFVSVALWWALFSIPLFRTIPEPPKRLDPDEDPAAAAARIAWDRLVGTFRELRTYRMAFLMLVAFLIYNDGIQTIIRFATIYGSEIGLERNHLIGAILLVQFVGVPFAFLFGRLARRIGPKRGVMIGLAVYVGISLLGWRMTTIVHFYALAVLVAMVQGGTQALSKSLFASMVPGHKSGEFFGFYGVMEKFAGIFGPALFTATVSLTGSSRNAILMVAGLFVIGGVLLYRVDVEEGRRVAREEEERARRAAELAS
jgi:UMF1 family MFS transporter